MSVSVYYSGTLERGKTAQNLNEYLKELSKKEKCRIKEVNEFYQFLIPQKVIEAPDGTHWYYTNRERIAHYSTEARLPKSAPYKKLCEQLNSNRFWQKGSYVWFSEDAEPLRFLFLNERRQLTELSQDTLSSHNTEGLPIQYIKFERETLATKTGYEHNPQNHEKALRILRDVNFRFFTGALSIRDPD